jgi:hypothetical protein
MPSEQEADRLSVGEATFACAPGAPSQARTAVADWLDGRSAEFRHDACLLVSELVTNSIRHADLPAGAPIVVRAAATNGVVRVEVHDQGNGPARRRASGAHEGGFGLHLVELLAARWGVNHQQGTCVWFELAARRGS